MGNFKQQGCYTEQQLIDWLLKGTQSKESELFKEHLQQCVSCQTLVAEWSELLDEATNLVNVNDDENAVKKLELDEEYETIATRVKDKLWNQVKPKEWKDQNPRRANLRKNNLWKWPLRQKALVSIAITFIFFVILLKGLPDHLDTGDRDFKAFGPEWLQMKPSEELVNDPLWANLWTYTDLEGNEQPLIWTHPQTVYYSGATISSEKGDSSVWFNPETEELLILVQDLSMNVDQDYQAWLIGGKTWIDMGILEFQNGLGHLYRKMEELKRAEMIRVSIEPKGGSRLPTGPDFFFIQLKSYE